MSVFLLTPPAASHSEIGSLWQFGAGPPCSLCFKPVNGCHPSFPCRITRRPWTGELLHMLLSVVSNSSHGVPTKVCRDLLFVNGKWLSLADSCIQVTYPATLSFSLQLSPTRYLYNWELSAKLHFHGLFIWKKDCLKRDLENIMCWWWLVRNLIWPSPSIFAVMTA